MNRQTDIYSERERTKRCHEWLLPTHNVVDIDRWLKGKAERAAAIGSAGTNVTDYVALDGSNHVAVTADIDDLDAVQALLASPPPDVAAQMESHGVRPPSPPT